MEEMNPNQPFESLAKKLLHNVFNGSYKHKANYIKEMADHYAIISLQDFQKAD